MIQSERIITMNDRDVGRGAYVLYWMQAAQREECNHALEYALQQANALDLPLVAAFGITDRYPEASERHYAFMLQGLSETQRALAERGVRLVVRRGEPSAVALDLAADAVLLVTDRGYLRVQKQWREHVAVHAPVRVVQVEGEVVVPVEEASTKEEFAARTLRPKILRLRDAYLRPLRRTRAKHDSMRLGLDGLDLSDPQAVLDSLAIDRSVPPVSSYRGGTSEAKRLLREFLRDKLARYHTLRNDPSLDIQSQMSPYLHFGQISPVYVALQVASADAPDEAKAAYLEELIVRRELAMNFVHYNPRYDAYAHAVPPWAQRTLAKHRADRRPERYSYEQMEHARTNDPYWNAAQRELVRTGKMHNYMRMYWGKRILEWTREPADAYRLALELNNRYELDGRDACSFSNVAWCFGKHDRPWGERPIFGTVRYMNAAGLRRKFDMETYVARFPG